MKKSAISVLALAALCAMAACRPARPNLAPRPEALGFPLMEAGSIRFEGTAVGAVRALYGTACLATDEGSVYAVDILARRILWRFKTERPLSKAPEFGEDHVLIRDEGNTVYILDSGGGLIFKTAPADPVTTAVREHDGRVYFGCGSGRIVALDLHQNGRPAWELDAGAAVVSGPVFSGNLIVFGTEGGRLLALDGNGKPAWAFAANGPLRVDPAAADGALYFGTSAGTFYGLAAATGKKRWSFRLPGAPVQPAVVAGKRVVLAAADSVVYCLSARSGEILWWRPVPARIVHAPVVADGVVLVSSLSREVSGYDLRGGYSVGTYRAAGDLSSGAGWATPYVYAIETDPSSGAERLAFLERDRRPVQTLGEKNPVRR